MQYWEDLYRQEKQELQPVANMISVPFQEQITFALNKLKTKTAAGPDGITAELLKGGGAATAKMSITLIQRIWNECYVPPQMK